MSSRRTFSKLKSRAVSSSNIGISFRFNPLDEELEEVSYDNRNTQNDSRSTDGSDSERALEKDLPIDRKNVEKKEGEVERQGIVGLVVANNGHEGKTPSTESFKVETIVDRKKAASQTEFSETSSPRLERKARSLDEDSRSAEGEVLPLLKDLKDRFARNLEECLNKDSIKNLVAAEGEIAEVKSSNELKGTGDFSRNIEVFDPLISPLTHSSTTDEDEHVSPSVEATETMEEQVLFDSVFQEEKQNSNPGEKVLGKLGSKTSPVAEKKKTSTHSEHMSFSFLMQSRAFSYEDVKPIVQDKKELQGDDTVITKHAKHNESPSPVHSSKEKVIQKFMEIFSRLSRLKSFIKSSKKEICLSIIIALLACATMFISSSFFGVLLGCFFIGISFIFGCFFAYVVLKPPVPKEPFVMPDYKLLPPLVINESKGANETIYKGWMNELPIEYNPDTYHVNCTHSVYVRLDGSHLRVSHPRTNIPRRAMFNEPHHELAFVRQRHYDLTGATVDLLPDGLNRKRLWSKKYPICIKICDQKQALSTDIIESPSSNLRSISKSQNSRESSPIKRYEPKVNENGEIVLYLFARTDREKYDWYHRFFKSTSFKMLKSYSPVSTPNIANLDSQSPVNKRAVSVDLGSLHQSSSLGNVHLLDSELEGDDDAFAEIKFDKQCKFEYYMSELLSSVPSGATHRRHIMYSKDKRDSPTSKTSKASLQSQPPQDFLWLNALIGRLCFDFLTEDVWSTLVRERIQKKLSKIKLPGIIEGLKITDINLGSALPKVHRSSKPVVNNRGLWIDLDISYNGSFQMTLETKLNLMKLQRSEGDCNPFAPDFRERELEDLPVRSRIYDSDEEDSAESSSDEEDIPLPEIGVASTLVDNTQIAPPTGSAGRKLIRLVDKIAQSSYFQTAAKNKYIQKTMMRVSNVPLVLTVEIQWLIGTLAINIPPMPTDRLWYGFRENPQLSIVARPKLGNLSVTLTHITTWIEKKLVLEFQKVLVMPNMDDLVIPIMQSDMESAKT